MSKHKVILEFEYDAADAVADDFDETAAWWLQDLSKVIDYQYHWFHPEVKSVVLEEY